MKSPNLWLVAPENTLNLILATLTILISGIKYFILTYVFGQNGLKREVGHILIFPYTPIKTYAYLKSLSPNGPASPPLYRKNFILRIVIVSAEFILPII